MSAEVESEQVLFPAIDSLQTIQDDEFEEWRKKIRTRVTTLKCHIMATQGLTSDGKLVEPYSPSILLENEPIEFSDSQKNEDELDSYVQVAMARLATRNCQSNSDASLPAVTLDDVQFSLDIENGSSLPPVVSPNTLQEIINSNKDNTDTMKIDEESSVSELDHDNNRAIVSNSVQNIQNSDSIWDNLYEEPNNIDDRCNLNYTEGKDYDQIKIEFLKQSQQIEKLSKIRDEVENELQDLTANLFQEAHNMVLGANQRAAAAERALKESNMQVEVLQAEVDALKTLVLTSTPSSPNPHLHPQIITRGAQAIAEAGKIFQRGHKKSPSDFDLKYGRDTTPPSSPLKESKLFCDGSGNGSANGISFDPDCWEVDPVLHREFVVWRQTPVLTRDDPFMERIYSEDVDLCLAFPNSTLAQKVQIAIEENALYIEEVNPRQKSCVPKKCVLLDVPRYCKYRFRLGDKDQTWYYISQLARNRIIAVCDFLNYLRYIQLGLVKSSIHDVYWEIVKLRRQMALARFGF